MFCRRRFDGVIVLSACGTEVRSTLNSSTNYCQLPLLRKTRGASNSAVMSHEMSGNLAVHGELPRSCLQQTVTRFWSF